MYKYDISVIIPAYNCESFIDRCINSILKQTVDENSYEIIIVDDASKDSTRHLLEKYKIYSNITILYNETNQGQGISRNIAIENASGRYIYFLDADDFIRKDCFEILLRAANNTECVVLSNLVKIDSMMQTHVMKRQLYDKEKVLAFCDGDFTFGVAGLLIHRKIANLICFDWNREKHEDVGYLAKLVFVTKKFVSVPNILYYYYENPDSTVNTYDIDKGISFIRYWIKAKKTLISNQKQMDAWLKKFFQICETIAVRAKKEGYSCQKIYSSIIAEAEKDMPHINRNKLYSIIENAKINNIKFYNTIDYKKIYGAVAFIADVDYHIRNYVPICRELKKRNIKSIIIDLSKYNRFDRTCTDEERRSFADVDMVSISYDCMRSLPYCARCYVFANDYGPTHRATIYDLLLMNVPVIGFYEGINDDFNVERKNTFLPYRLVDYVLLPGEYYKNIYKKNSYVTGSPAIKKLLAEKPTFPNIPQAVINVNFTYGVLEEKRNTYLNAAISGCKKTNFDYVISQHPADTGNVDLRYKTSKTIYESIAEGSVLISRFSTCILEALAMGKPVIYFNPIEEKFDKFMHPMGAYPIATTVEELESSLLDIKDKIENNFDFRAAAKDFLQHHTNIFSDSIERLSADAIEDILKKDIDFEERDNRFRFLYTQNFPISLPTPPKSKPTPAAPIPTPALPLTKKDIVIRKMTKLIKNPYKFFEDAKGPIHFAKIFFKPKTK